MIIEGALAWVIKTISGEVFRKVIDCLHTKKLAFYKATVTYMYSHYDVNGNHVRAGGQRKIYKSYATLTLYNPGKSPTHVRDLCLICTINGKPYSFHLYDTMVEAWKGDYNLPAMAISTLTWLGLPEGHFIIPGEPGIIPIEIDDTVEFHFSYMGKRNRLCLVKVDIIYRYRLNPLFIGV